MRSICFIYISSIFVNMINTDTGIKNRWKHMEMLQYKSDIWVLFASAYICLDYLFLLCAFFQTNKILKHYQ